MKQIIVNIENEEVVVEKIEVETQADLNKALKAIFAAFVAKSKDLPK